MRNFLLYQIKFLNCILISYGDIERWKMAKMTWLDAYFARFWTRLYGDLSKIETDIDFEYFRWETVDYIKLNFWTVS